MPSNGYPGSPRFHVSQEWPCDYRSREIHFRRKPLMSRFPGMALSFVLLIFLFCLGLTEKWNPAILGVIAAVLGCLVIFLVIQGIIGGVKYYRLLRRETHRDKNHAIRRLVKSLASKDRETAKRAARLLGELTSQGQGPGLSPFPVEDAEPSWRRWNDWWAANRNTFNFKNDKS